MITIGLEKSDYLHDTWVSRDSQGVILTVVRRPR